MERNSGGRLKRIVSWALAALIIAGGAIAIGWFAGIALVNFLEPEPFSMEEELNEQETPGMQADNGTLQAQSGEAAPASITLPAIFDQLSADLQEDEESSPFSSPPWSSGVNIKPINETAGIDADEHSPVSESAADAPINQEYSASIQETGGTEAISADVEQPEITEAKLPQVTNPDTTQQKVLFRVRVGPYITYEEANEASVKLKQTGLPVLVLSDGTAFWVQVGAFSVWTNADALAKKIRAEGYQVTIAN